MVLFLCTWQFWASETNISQLLPDQDGLMGRKPSLLFSWIVNCSFLIKGQLAITNTWILEDFSSKRKPETLGLQPPLRQNWVNALEETSVEVGGKGVLVSAWLLLDSSWLLPLRWPYQFLVTLNNPHVCITLSHTASWAMQTTLEDYTGAEEVRPWKLLNLVSLTSAAWFLFSFATADEHSYHPVAKSSRRSYIKHFKRHPIWKTQRRPGRIRQGRYSGPFPDGSSRIHNWILFVFINVAPSRKQLQ